jgi:hypothetical protein
MNNDKVEVEDVDDEEEEGEDDGEQSPHGHA